MAQGFMTIKYPRLLLLLLFIASDELKQLVSKIDIVKPIVAVMNKYKGNCYFYSYGLGALSSLSLVGKYKKEALNRKYANIIVSKQGACVQ